jgi:pimeloyl-ACP methyl ester carboxylesterase
MKLDITAHKGDSQKPVVIFIHGLAMDKNFWLYPLETKAFGKNVPLKYLAARKPRFTYPTKKITIGHVPEKIHSLWDSVIQEGFSAVCWSQRRPVGPVSVAVEELREVLSKVKKRFPSRPVAFVCHSRGGLVARKFMESRPRGIKALITISSPHGGSSLSKIGNYIDPLSKPLKAMVPKESHGAVSRIVKSLKELIDGKALKELMPDSDFIKNLKDARSEKIRYLSFGGKKASLINIYRLENKNTDRGYKILLTVPDSLLKHLSVLKIPDELKSGKGDFMVTAKSSVLPWTTEHYNLQANHFTISWNRKVREKTLEVLKKI